MLFNSKFDDCEYGDGLSNLDEYIIGTHPKKKNTDKMVVGSGSGQETYDDKINDGAEIFAGGSSGSFTKGGVIYRTGFDNGSRYFSSYTGGYVYYDWDGKGSTGTARNYTYSRTVTDPPANSPGSAENLTLLFRLKDGSGVFMDETRDHIYIWSGTDVIPDSQETSSGYKVCPGTVALYNKSANQESMTYSPSDRNREVYFSNPFEIDSDQDGIYDGDEIDKYLDTDSDYISNIRDTDSDGDGLLDKQELYWNGDNDTDGEENMVDSDSDNDGIEDGDEVSWNFDTDGDGEENMLDPDSDGDGLADGYIPGKIWNPIYQEFQSYSTFVSEYSSYSFPDETYYIDPWEGEDLNGNGIHDNDEPDPTKVDTDGDSLWDGFDNYTDPNSRTGTPAHYGELYYCKAPYSTSDIGMIFSAGDQRRVAQYNIPVGSNIQMTSQTTADTDGDGLSDYEELLTWYLKIEDFKPAFNTSASEYPKTYFAFNDIAGNELASDPNRYDTDGDGLSDNHEYMFTNPLDIDSDNDGLTDIIEDNSNYGVFDYDETNPCDRDTDDDGLPDGWADGWNYGHPCAVSEIETGEAGYNEPASWTGDATWNNYCEFGECRYVDGEYEWISNPLNKDTDDDGIRDGIEFCYLWNVADNPFQDSDGDGTGDLYELDSDNDHWLDSEENRDLDMYLDGWYAIYGPGNGENWNSSSPDLPTGASWLDSEDKNQGYKILHYNESDPTKEDCDFDGLIDSVEPDPYADTDEDGYINLWDRDSNDAKGNGPGVGPINYVVSTSCDTDGDTDNSWDFDQIINWALSDYNQTYIVFRTNATDIDGDYCIDYADEANVGMWISVDILVNTKRNEDSETTHPYYLEHSWSSTGFVICSTVNQKGSNWVQLKVYYGTDNLSDPLDLETPEGYAVYYDSNNNDIYIELSANNYVKCINGTGSAPGDFSTSCHSQKAFAQKGQETIDGRAALDMDPDCDGISTKIEENFGLNPYDADTDNDGVLDGAEPEWWANSDNDNQLYSGAPEGFESINALDPDSDNDGVLDGTELGVSYAHEDSTGNVYKNSSMPHDYPILVSTEGASFDADNGKTTTNPLISDTDGDGLSDGWNNSNYDSTYDSSTEYRGEDSKSSYFNSGDWTDGAIAGDTNKDGIWNNGEKWTETSPNDQDSDDDGISDHDETFCTDEWYEDYDGDGMINAVDPDSDNDGLYDALERGYTPGNATGDTDLSRPYFVPDTDHCTTDPYDDDTDQDTIKDGTEDANHNGKIDGDNGDGIYSESETFTETNPNSWDTDQDSIRDQIEKQYGYNPLSDDTDCDGLNETEEDKNSDGDLDAGETNPLEMDTDGDGLLDKQEIDGWTVVIVLESTGEQDDRYDVYSDPRKVHSDNDNVDDYSEYKNATDPTKEDTDGDGKNDYVEINEYKDSSPWGIDGVAPNITGISTSYEEKFGGLTGIKLIGVDVKITITCKDDFGVSWIRVMLEGEGEKKVYFDDETVVKHTFSFRSDDYAKILWNGFDINITASDRNSNVGYKEDEVKGIIKAKFDALLGPLLSFAQVLKEMISKLCDWLYDLPGKLLTSIISQAESLKNKIYSMILLSTESIRKYIMNEGTKSNDKYDFIYNLFDLIFQMSFAAIIALLMVTIIVIEMIVTGVSFGTVGIISSVLSVVITIVAVVILTQEESREAAFGLVEKACDCISDFLGIDDNTVIIVLENLLLGVLGYLIGLFSLSPVYGMTVGTQGSAAYAFLHYELDIILIGGFKNAIFWSVIAMICSTISSIFINCVEKPLEKLGDFILGIFFLILSGISSALALIFAGSGFASGWQKIFNFGCTFAGIAFTIATLFELILKYGLDIDPQRIIMG